MQALGLKKINIDKNRLFRNCKNDDINDQSWYLVIVDGRPFIGRFGKQWYGWNFVGWTNPAGIQLDGIQEVYEIVAGLDDILDKYKRLRVRQVDDSRDTESED